MVNTARLAYEFIDYFNYKYFFSRRKMLKKLCKQFGIKTYTFNSQGVVVYKREQVLLDELSALGV